MLRVHITTKQKQCSFDCRSTTQKGGIMTFYGMALNDFPEDGEYFLRDAMELTLLLKEDVLITITTV